MPKAHFYIRVSSEEQSIKGLGLEAQTDQCLDTFNSIRTPLGLSLGKTFCDDGISGFTTAFFSRPAGAALLNTVNAGDYVIVAKVDRAFRLQRDFEDATEILKRMGVVLYVIDMNWDTLTGDDNIGSWSMMRLAMLFAEYWPRLCSIRTKEGFKRKRAKGERVSLRPPLGYRFARIHGTTKRNRPLMIVVPDRDAVKLARLIVLLKDRCGLGSRKAAKRIDELFANRENRKPVVPSNFKLKPSSLLRLYDAWRNGLREDYWKIIRPDPQ